MELTRGVHAFPQSIDRDDYTVTINPAAVETPKGILLIDVGFPDQVDAIEDHLEEIDRDWTDVTGVLLTHQDGDHAGALAAVVDRTDAPVYAHERAAPYVDGREDPIKSEGERYPPADVDVELVGGVIFRTEAGPMQVVFTPGHAPGHVSLYFPRERFLVAADALTAQEGLAGPSEEFTIDMEEAARSVGKLADLDVERTLCYHGGFVEEGKARIDEIHEELAGG